MTTLGDVLKGIRQTILIEHRVTEIAADLKELNRRELDTRERVIRLEGIFSGAQMNTAAKRLR